MKRLGVLLFIGGVIMLVTSFSPFALILIGLATGLMLIPQHDTREIDFQIRSDAAKLRRRAMLEGNEEKIQILGRSKKW